jgi:O-antigen/teichoic acid export membrane protein
MKAPDNRVPAHGLPPLGRRILDGAMWNSVQVLVARGSSLIVKLILARLLLPEDFGIVGMAAVFIDVIGAASDLGLAAALIQLKQEKVSELHFITAYWSSVGFSLLLLLILIFVIGPFAVWVYEEPALQAVIPVLGLGTFFQSLGVIHRVVLSRELRFKPLGLAESFAAVISGGAAIALALLGAGVWALVVQDISMALIALPLLWRAVKWRPSFAFSTPIFKEIFGAGLYDMLLNITSYFTKNIDYLLIGVFLGPGPLGVYTLAFILTDSLRQQIWSVLSNVMFPVYAQLQDDPIRVKQYYLGVVKYNLIVLAPIMLILLFFSGTIIRLLFGTIWSAAAFPLQVMSLSAIVMTIGGTTGSVFRGLGRFDINFRITILSVIFVALPAFSIGIHLSGINGAAIALLVYQIALRVFFQIQMRRVVGVRELEILRAIRIPAFACLVVLPLIIWFDLSWSPFDLLSLSVSIVSICIVYFVTVYLFDKKELARMYQRLTT